MLKKLIIVSIAASLFSMPLVADRHHHHEHEKERIKEKVAEVKAKEKTTREKALAGTVQAVNKLSWLVAIAIGAAVYFVPANSSNDKLWQLGYGFGASVVSYAVIKTVTAAAMSQEDIKPLKK